MRILGTLAVGTVVLATIPWYDTGSEGSIVPGPESAATGWGAYAHDVHAQSSSVPDLTPPRAALPVDSLTEVVQRYCVNCHNDRRMRGNLSLASYRVDAAAEMAPLTEKIIAKLRAGMMPMPGARRPGPDTLSALVETLERIVDASAARSPNPGGRPFQRLNRAEYEASIHDLLGLRIDAGDFLPLDTKSENFDNIADVQMLSPTLLDAYLNAASEISRLALGDAGATSTDRKYTISGYASQTERMEGAPIGTRGGITVEHVFPADGEYVFRMTFEHTTTGAGFFGRIARFEQLEVSVDGERVALLDVDQWMTFDDADVLEMETDPVFVRAGPQRVSAAFLRRTEGPVEDLMSPHDWSLADRHTGISGYGLTFLPHLRDLIVSGPQTVSGVSDSQVRARILACGSAAPESVRADEEAARRCAAEVIERLASRAYRRPLTERDRGALLSFYEDGVQEGGFEIGVRTALQAILASPYFIFRFEEPSEAVAPGDAYRISEVDLAARLAFFLWGGPPDAALRGAADSGELSDPAGIERQVRRMLADPRAGALATRFASQWLRLQDLDKVHPDSYWFPDFDQQLAESMLHETELFFGNIVVREDRSLFELFDGRLHFRRTSAWPEHYENSRRRWETTSAE